MSQLEKALKDLMTAYERKFRSECSPQQLADKPWETFEYCQARAALSAETPSGMQRSEEESETCDHDWKPLSDGTEFCPKCWEGRISSRPELKSPPLEPSKKRCPCWPTCESSDV